MFDSARNSTDPNVRCMINVSLFLKFFGTPIVFLGLIGNFLSTLVFSRKSLRSRSCSIYFLALSLSDSLVLISYACENLLFHGYGIQLLSKSSSCKSIIFLIYASTDVSNYLLMLAAIDRSILISSFRFRQRICRKSTAKLFVAVVVLFFAFLNSHILFGFDVDPLNGCVPISPSYVSFYVRHYDSYIDIIKTVLIPFTLILYCNSFIILVLARRRTNFTESTPAQQETNRRREKDRQLTRVLLATSILFICFSLPAEINDFIRTHFNEDFQSKYSCQLWATTSVLILIQQTNHASHFYLYTLTGPIFRDEFRKLIHCNENLRCRPLRSHVSWKKTADNFDRTEMQLV